MLLRRVYLTATLRLLVLLGSSGLALVPASGTRATPAAFPGTPGWIAFNVGASGKGISISAVSPDGIRTRRIMAGRVDAFSPSWSADGRRLTFVMAGAVWRVNADGRQLTRITSWSVVDPQSPAWSPDATRVVFAARTTGRRFDIYVKRLNNSRLRRLTAGSHVDEHPSWSPDGKRIVFGRSLLFGGSLQSSELWVMNADGSHERRVGIGNDPDWSPGGKRLAYTRGEEIWVSKADGRVPFPVISGPGMAGDPAWSPDGRWIVFWSDQASTEATKGDLYVATADGELVQRLTFEPELWHFAPSWQPNSKRRG